jgi:hypothetical protein
MSSVENIELRQRLEEMTVRGGEPMYYRNLLSSTSNDCPNTIQPLKPNLPEGCYTCGMYVLDFSEKEEYIKIAGFGVPQVYAGRAFFEWLLENHFFRRSMKLRQTRTT